MAEDQGKEEEKFDFTPEGEAVGYISLAQARLLAMQTAGGTPGNYGRRYRDAPMVFESVEAMEEEDFYNITLSFRPQGQFSGTPGQEQFFIEKEGTVAVRQVLSLPVAQGGRRFPLLPVVIGLVVVGIIVAVGAVFMLGGTGDDKPMVAVAAPTETSVATEAPTVSSAPAAPAAQVTRAPTAPAAQVTRAPTVPSAQVTRAPTAPSAPVATQASASGQAPVTDALTSIAAKFAGGPGAIYVGDLNQLVGPAPTEAQGDFDGNVPLAALERHLWIYESPYYQDLLEKANFDNPTELVTSGTSLEIQHVCINRALLPCQLVDSYFAPNVLARTNGQVDIQISSFPELGIAGPDTLSLVADGTLAMANVYSGYILGELPELDIQFLWGVYPNHEITYKSQTSMHPELEEMVLAKTGGVTVNHNWFSGIDQFFFCNDKLTSLDDFEGKKTRSHSASISDWIEGMGGEAQFVAFSEVYTALERGILDCGVTGADPAYGQRWYEVTKYMNGPLISFFTSNNVVNKKVWAKLAPDLQAILIEEGAIAELEALRIAAIQNEIGVERNTRAGLELVEFSAEMKAASDATLTSHVIPGWLRRVGRNDRPAIDLFNEKVGPWVGLKINPDGTTSEAPITKK